MPRKNFLLLLQGGDRRAIGRADQVAAAVIKNPQLFPELIAGLWSEDRLVRMRAADAAEKATRENREPLMPYKKELLGLMVEAKEQELRWHLAVMVPRLALNGKERKLAVTTLSGYLEDRSSIVKTFALQGLADLAEGDLGIRPGVIELLREATRSGTAAMKARGPEIADSTGETLMKQKTGRSKQRPYKTMWNYWAAAVDWAGSWARIMDLILSHTAGSHSI